MKEKMSVFGPLGGAGDYVTRNPRTLAGQLALDDDARRRARQQELTVPAPRGGGGGAFGEVVDALREWYLEHIPPLRWGLMLAEYLGQATWKLKAVSAGLGSFAAAAALESGHAWTGADSLLGAAFGAYAPMVWLALGLLAGWFLPFALALTILLATCVVAVALALATIAVALWMLWLAVTRFIG